MSTEKFPVLGFDIGGTKIAICLAMSDGTVLASGRVSNKMKKPNEVLPLVVAEGERLLAEAGLAKKDLRAVGISSPSPMDFDKGLICNPCNLNGWIDVPIRDYLGKAFETEAFFDNDANGAGLAEWFFGAGKGTQDMIYLTMSTGIGGGIIAGGKLLRGRHNLAGEVGHMSIDSKGLKCNCGLVGCYEAYCGGVAMANNLRRELADKPDSMIVQLAGGDYSKIDAICLEKAIRANDPFALEFWDRVMERNAQAMGALINVFNPEMIVLGTIVKSMGPLFMDPLMAKLPAYAWQQNIDTCKFSVTGISGKSGGELAGVAIALNFLYERGDWQLPW